MIVTCAACVSFGNICNEFNINVNNVLNDLIVFVQNTCTTTDTTTTKNNIS